MNLAKSKVVLKKINTLHDNILLSGKVSKIEKDLLLDYLRELYEVVLEKEGKGKSKKENSSKQAEKERFQIKSSHTPLLIEEEEIKVEEVVLEEEMPQYEMVEVSDTVQHRNGHTQEAVQTLQSEEKPKPLIKLDPKIESLFNDESNEQHSYRFSQTPITDISKSMGINEKILTVNKLFNKDQQEFNYVATKLNYFNTFAEACQYLKSEVAVKYDWASEKKRPKAIDFIRLVRRKYTS